MKSLESITEELQSIYDKGIFDPRCIEGDRFSTLLYFDLITEIFNESENILYVVRAEIDNKGGTVFCTTQRVIYINQGVFQMIGGGNTQIEVSIDKISSVTKNSGAFTGNVEIYIGGGSKKMHLTFTRPNSKKVIEPFVQALNEAMAGLQTTTNDVYVTAPTDVATQLEKFGNLYEKGLLTKEEFEIQKKLLLGI